MATIMTLPARFTFQTIFLIILIQILWEQRVDMAAISENSKQLKLLHVIFRHGERSPASTYPTDPYADFKFAPYGWGQLTNDGRKQMYELGVYLRQKYGKFLGTLYTPKICYIQSTDTDRTKMSVQLVSAGLWSPNNQTQWGPLDWQPISFNSEPLDQDKLLLVRVPCPKWNIERDRIEKSDEVQKIYADNQNLFEKLTNYTGTSVKNVDDILDLQGTLLAEKTFDLKLPEWAEKYYEKIEPLAALHFDLNTKTEILRRLKGGVLLKKITNDWKDLVNNQLTPSERKIFLYCGHDSTIANLLATLNVWKSHVPDYGETIILELLEDTVTGVYGVQIFHKSGANSVPQQLQIPNCDFFCPLDKLLEQVQQNIPEDWDEECKSDVEGYTAPPPAPP